ncbi:MAG: KxYKxGKxW signal peptide domain-containing protein, partial [Lactovum sp.]
MANEFLNRKKTGNQNKNTNFRTWKSNKTWLYSSSVLAALAGGAIMGQTDVQANTAVSSAATVVTSAVTSSASMAPVSTATQSVAVQSTAVESVAIQSVAVQSTAVESVATQSVATQSVSVQSTAVASSTASSSATSEVAVSAQKTSVAVQKTSVAAQSTEASQSGTESSVAVGAYQDPTSSYAESGKEQTSPTAAIVFDPFITQSLAALSKVESTAATKDIIGSYNSYTNISVEQGSSYMASMVAAAQNAIASAAKTAGTYAEVATWTEFSSAFANESLSYIQVSSGATITNPTSDLNYTAISTARTS